MDKCIMAPEPPSLGAYDADLEGAMTFGAFRPPSAQAEKTKTTLPDVL
jgi:hypothetical protein